MDHSFSTGIHLPGEREGEEMVPVHFPPSPGHGESTKHMENIIAPWKRSDSPSGAAGAV